MAGRNQAPPPLTRATNRAGRAPARAYRPRKPQKARRLNKDGTPRCAAHCALRISANQKPCRTRVARALRQPTRRRKVRSDIGKKHKTPESDLRVSVVAHARSQDYLVIGSLNDIYLADEGASMARLKQEGLFVGAPDILILEPGGGGEHGIAIELKIGNNQPSDVLEEAAAFLIDPKPEEEEEEGEGSDSSSAAVSSAPAPVAFVSYMNSIVN